MAVFATLQFMSCAAEPPVVILRGTTLSQSVSKAGPRLPKAGLLILALVFAELLSAVELAMVSAGTAVAAFIIGLFFVPATGGISHQGFIVAITVVTVLGAVGVAVSLFLSRRPQMWQPLVAHPAAANAELVPQQPCPLRSSRNPTAL